jgi:hypothetical protein
MDNRDAVVVDTLRQLRATEQEEQAAVVTAMAAVCGQSVVLGAALLAQAREGQAGPVIRRR